MSQAADRLADRPECRLVAIRSVLAVPGNPRDHQARIDRVQPDGTDPQPLQLAGAEIFHQHVRPGGELQHDVAILLQIQFDRELVAAMDAEPHRVAVFRRTPAAKRIATRRLQLDHLGAKVGQDARAERRSDIMADFEDFQSDKGQGAHDPLPRVEGIAVRYGNI